MALPPLSRAVLGALLVLGLASCTRVPVPPPGKSVVYLSVPRARPTTVPPATEPPPTEQTQYYVAHDYQKYYAYSTTTSEPPTSSSTEATTATAPPTASADGHGAQSQIDALVRMLLGQNLSRLSPKFLIVLPLGGFKSKPTEAITTTTSTAAPTSPSTVKPKPRRKIKYIVVNQ